MAKKQSHAGLFIAFWLGLLTGALIVALIFMYQSYNSTNLQDAMIKKWVESSLGVDSEDILIQP